MNRLMKTVIIMYIKMDHFLSHATVNNNTELPHLLHIIILYYNYFLSSEHLKEMDFPSLSDLRSSESVPTVCGINILPAPVYCKAFYMLNWHINWIFVCLAIIYKK